MRTADGDQVSSMGIIPKQEILADDDADTDTGAIASGVSPEVASKN